MTGIATFSSNDDVRSTLHKPSSKPNRAAASSKRAAADSHGLISLSTDWVASRIMRCASDYIVTSKWTIEERRLTSSYISAEIEADRIVLAYRCFFAFISFQDSAFCSWA